MERRVFVSVNSDRTLDLRRRQLKKAILDLLIDRGYSPQVFFESGLPQNLSWSFANVNAVMRRCVAALILGFPRWRVTPSEGGAVKLVGEYSHFEGAVALAYGLPTLIAAEQGVADQGIMYHGGGMAIASIAPDADASTLLQSDFVRSLDTWLTSVNKRRDVFIGYCSKSSGKAAEIQLYVQRAGATVHNWAMDFRAGVSILEELENARDLCGRAIFVFSEDDPLEGPAGQAAPRDNVVFEAGYFIATKGAKNCLIVRVGDAKMPADLGGAIYLSLQRDESVSHLEASLTKFVQASIE